MFASSLPEISSKSCNFTALQAHYERREWFDLQDTLAWSNLTARHLDLNTIGYKLFRGEFSLLSGFAIGVAYESDLLLQVGGEKLRIWNLEDFS